MAHDLYLGMYSFKIKKIHTSNSDYIDNNSFLSKAYPDAENKFTEGFVNDVIEMLDKKAFKNEQNTHGAILEQQAISSSVRTLDLLIDGGITGIKQSIIDEEGNKQELSNKDIVGLKFYSRIWLPGNSSTGFIFIQKYGSLSIKPVFDSIIYNALKKHGYALVNRSIKPTTTKERLKQFLKYSSIRDITIISRQSSHETGAADAISASIKLKNVVMKNSGKPTKKEIDDALRNHGFSIADRKYEFKATYTRQNGDKAEEKTAYLDDSEKTINIIPNILIPRDCIDADNYPSFTKMQEFVDLEMNQVKKESKL